MANLLTDSEIDALLEVVNEHQGKNFFNSLCKELKNIKKMISNNDIDPLIKIQSLIQLQTRIINDIEFNFGTVLDMIKDFNISGKINDPEIKIYQGDKNFLDLIQDLKNMRNILNKEILKLSIEIEREIENKIEKGKSDENN